MFDLETVREQFPALSIVDGEMPRVYFDNPGGTQVSQRVVDSMSDCLISSNANIQGHFRTSQMVDELVESAHVARRNRVRPEHDDADSACLEIDRALFQKG
jgi:selenocysteine lyase/cysteine desulfurase